MDDEIALPGGNVGGAVRVGDTVRRATGPWTPAVHGLLNYLADAGLPGVPRVLGFDDRGREILDYLPGTSYGEECPTTCWRTRCAGWPSTTGSSRRTGPRAKSSGGPARRARADQIVCMHDYGCYNWIGTEAGFIGVIDWDMAGPGVPLDDIAFTAWNTAPLALPGDPAYQAASAAADGRGVRRQLHPAADPRRRAGPRSRSARVIRAGQEAGDPGMLNLAKVGEPEHRAPPEGPPAPHPGDRRTAVATAGR